MMLLYLAKWNALLAIRQQHQKGTKFHKKKQKSVSAYCWVVYRVVEVDIKVIIVGITRNQFLQCVINVCCNTATARRHWTEQWQRDLSSLISSTIQNRIYQFFRKTISDESSFCSLILSAMDLQCHVFSFWKAFVKCPSLSFWWRPV